MSGRETAAVACSGQNSASLASSPTSSQVLGSISTCVVFFFFLLFFNGAGSLICAFSCFLVSLSFCPSESALVGIANGNYPWTSTAGCFSRELSCVAAPVRAIMLWPQATCDFFSQFTMPLQCSSYFIYIAYAWLLFVRCCLFEHFAKMIIGNRSLACLPVEIPTGRLSF